MTATILDDDHLEALAQAAKVLNERRGASLSESEVLKLAVAVTLGTAVTSSDEQLQYFITINLEKLRMAMEHDAFDGLKKVVQRKSRRDTRRGWS